MRRAALAAVLGAVALCGCGGGGGNRPSGVSAAAYVTARCTTLTAWKNTVQKAGTTIQAERPKTLRQGKQNYVDFVATLLHATRRATSAMRAAGTPQVTDGAQIAQRLVSTFTAAERALRAAATRAGAIPTKSTTSYAKAVGALTTSISQTLTRMGSVSPGSSGALQAAAAKAAACKALVS